MRRLSKSQRAALKVASRKPLRMVGNYGAEIADQSGRNGFTGKQTITSLFNRGYLMPGAYANTFDITEKGFASCRRYA